MSQSLYKEQLAEAILGLCASGNGGMPSEVGEEILKVIREELAPLVELAASPYREYMNEKAASLYCGMPATTLRTKRSLGKGPSYIKEGGKVLYARKDLDRYMAARKIKTYEQK